jgi:hypothetical protein
MPIRVFLLSIFLLIYFYHYYGITYRMTSAAATSNSPHPGLTSFASLAAGGHY